MHGPFNSGLLVDGFYAQSDAVDQQDQTSPANLKPDLEAYSVGLTSR